MPAILFTNESRGGSDHGWLRTKFSYSFANYYDPDRMGFGALRVVNDDWIGPGAGFLTHGHQNMEIITIPLTGALAHKDDAGGEGRISAGMVQVMSAGVGVLHSEFNASDTEPVELLQIWIEPKTLNVSPRYQDAEYSLSADKTESLLLVGPKEKSETWIHQDAYLSRITVLAGDAFEYSLHNKANGVYIFVIEGVGTVLGQKMKKRDALEITEEEAFSIAAKETMDILSIELPFK